MSLEAISKIPATASGSKSRGHRRQCQKILEVAQRLRLRFFDTSSSAAAFPLGLETRVFLRWLLVFRSMYAVCAPVILSTLICGVAFAGTEGHGGGGVVCSSDDPTNLDVSILDFAEAGWGHPSEAMRRAGGNRLENWIKLARGRIKSYDAGFAVYTDQALGLAITIRRSPPEGSWITPPSDAMLEFLPRGCSLVGIARWKDSDNVLYIDNELMNRMRVEERAATWIHEAVYKVTRVFLGDGDSLRTRALVRYAFDLGDKGSVDNFFYPKNGDANEDTRYPTRSLPTVNKTLNQILQMNWNFPMERLKVEARCKSKSVRCMEGVRRIFQLAFEFVDANLDTTQENLHIEDVVDAHRGVRLSQLGIRNPKIKTIFKKTLLLFTPAHVSADDFNAIENGDETLGNMMDLFMEKVVPLPKR